MEQLFFKYHGTGNDFILIDNRQDKFPKNDTTFIMGLCDRKFGIGADGLILLNTHPTLDFEMDYFNADGHLGSMCGNGGRCLVHLVRRLGLIADKCTFKAVDGEHKATIIGERVSISMNHVSDIQIFDRHTFLNTGSPHHVQMVDELDVVNVKKQGGMLRHEIYGEEGANINFVTKSDDAAFAMRTYERGVEDETLSCGTGAVAAAIAMFETRQTTSQKITLETLGGTLTVGFEKDENLPDGKAGGYKNIYLEGPAVPVFKGYWP